MLEPTIVPVATMLPLTDNISAGEVVPMPTLPPNRNIVVVATAVPAELPAKILPAAKELVNLLLQAVEEAGDT
jgi:hypothetical protein